MAFIRVSLLVLVAAAASSALFFSSSKNAKWNNVKVTLGIKLFNKYAFDGLPLTENAAKDAKWTSLSGSDCTNGGKFNGFRYVPKDQPSIVTIYDVKGKIAGFQMLADKKQILSDPRNNYRFGDQPMFLNESINGVEKLVLTAYFIDPATICTSGRDSSVADDEIGNGLWFQNGMTPSDLIEAPLKRTEAAAEGYNNNRCLPLNGYHNFYHSDQWGVNNCTDMRPMWLFYNKNDDLMGFGFTVVGNDQNPRFQHPPGAIVKFVLGDGAPQCAQDIGETVQFTNINVHFENHPETITCKNPITEFVSGLLYKYCTSSSS
jgi:hypothetical protein